MEEVMNHEGAIFMQYHYAEVKDLAKTFLTLVAGVLVVSLTFSEKIIDFLKASLTQRVFLVITWVLFIISIILSGIALCYLAVAGGMAMYDEDFTLGASPDAMRYDYFTYPVRLANYALIGAGTSFTSGLATLIFAAALAAWQRKAPLSTDT
jgi:hypothetical protein